MDNVDLRQWFLLPIPPGALQQLKDKPKVTIEVRKVDESTTRLFGAYDTSQQCLSMPSLTSYSWEKAFYGVENDSGITDTRYDIKVPIRDCCVTSYSEGTTKPPGNFFIHLLAVPQASQTASQTVTSLKKVFLKVPPGETWSCCLTDLPQWTSNSLWLVRISGQVKSQAGTAMPGIEVSARSCDPVGNAFTYTSPWSPHIVSAGAAWTKFDVAFPIKPSALPGHLSRLDCMFHQLSPRADLGPRPTRAHSCVEFANVCLEVLALPNLPIAYGHKVY
ncbi:MAG: hypothetical protein HY711_05640 [Candidatus Melainabacteria bacterium]|nr:hypothetical protein [Candidatus Melainabacteria bacterium]